MADSQKLDYGPASTQTARNQASSQVHSVPKRLPVSVVSIDKTNSIITLKFETSGSPFQLPNVTIPLSGSEYIRYPITKGDKGFVTAADTNIGNMSGQGPNGAANFALPANLTPLVFTPFGNTNFTPTDDQTALLHYGPTGTINRDTNKKAKHTVHPTSGVTTQTGAQGQTGPTSNPTYNMTSLLHPLNGLLHTIKDSQNGDHTQSIVPQGGSGGPIGMLLSVFGGKHTHAIGQSGHSLTSSSQVNVTAPTTNINSTNTSISGNTSIGGILSALGGMASGFGGGSGPGGGGQGGINQAGGIFGTSVTNSGSTAQTSYQYVVPVTGATVTLTTSQPITIIDPIAPLAALTVQFPSDASVINGTMVSFAPTRAITALTLTGGSGTTWGQNAPTSFPAGGGQTRWLYNAPLNEWFLI